MYPAPATPDTLSGERQCSGDCRAAREEEGEECSCAEESAAMGDE